MSLQTLAADRYLQQACDTIAQLAVSNNVSHHAVGGHLRAAFLRCSVDEADVPVLYSTAYGGLAFSHDFLAFVGRPCGRHSYSEVVAFGRFIQDRLPASTHGAHPVKDDIRDRVHAASPASRAVSPCRDAGGRTEVPGLDVGLWAASGEWCWLEIAWVPRHASWEVRVEDGCERVVW